MSFFRAHEIHHTRLISGPTRKETNKTHRQRFTAAAMLMNPQERESYLAEQNNAITSLRGLLQTREAQLAEERSDVTAHNQLIRAVVQRRGAEVAAEDALDTILRLEALIKLEKRRNELLARENIAQRTIVGVRREEVKKLHDQFHELQQATGWSAESKHFKRDRADAQSDIDQMKELEAKLGRNLKAAELIIAKKYHTIALLQEELKKKKVVQESLHEVYNAIRVKDRDCQEVNLTLQALSGDGDKREVVLLAAQSQKDDHAFACIELDNKFLRQGVAEVRVSRQKMDNVSRLQLERIAALKSRMAALAAAMHDLRVDARFAQYAQQNGGAVIVATPVATEEDIDIAIQHAQPADEVIAPECFDLLCRDHEQMKAMVSRKEIILLEKQLVHESLVGKVDALAGDLDQANAERDHIQRQTAVEIDQLRGELQRKHEACRVEIDAMLTQNRRLRHAMQLQDSRVRRIKAEAAGGAAARTKWAVK